MNLRVDLIELYIRIYETKSKWMQRNSASLKNVKYKTSPFYL